jgi:hypothetical protein
MAFSESLSKSSSIQCLEYKQLQLHEKFGNLGFVTITHVGIISEDIENEKKRR